MPAPPQPDSLRIKFKLLGVSTSWRSRSVNDGAALAREVAGLGVSAAEIDFRLNEKALGQFLDESARLNVTPVSVHAVCPAPPDKPDRQLAEAAQLCDEDETARKRAVEDTANTIRLAARIGVKAVVVHAGTVPMDKVTLNLQAMYDDGSLNTAEGRRHLNEFRIERLARRGATFDRLLKSLEELAVTAGENSVYLGVENRYYFREYPNFEEMAIIFQRLAGSRIRYWHDTGHAQVQENLGIAPHRAWLEEFGDHMIGVHIHDVDGYTDHAPPPTGGRGGVDFGMIEKYMKPDTIKILEMRDNITAEAARAGVEWLRARGF